MKIFKFMLREKSDPIEIRLNAIIRLLSDSLIVNQNVTKALIYKSLNEVGLQPTEIGNIFGKSRTDIGAQLPKKKKTKPKKTIKGVKND